MEMTFAYMALSGVYLLVSVALVIIILSQKKKSAGLGGAMGGMGSSAAPQTYWDKNKGRSLEGTLHRYTKVLGAIFIILSLILTIV
ncbi:MAG: preprotein translocase subunit SecG [Defluviitaleaceae bacterium]|nr:preprotein translocase subunit SecG [Defluviitaleaceae bacterium]